MVNEGLTERRGKKAFSMRYRMVAAGHDACGPIQKKIWKMIAERTLFDKRYWVILLWVVGTPK
jgi:hypothetical protein